MQTPRDSEALKRIGAILRHFGSLGFLQSEEWHPHYPLLNGSGPATFASAWPLAAGAVYLVINQGGKDDVAAIAASGERRYYDCYHGEQLSLITQANRTQPSLPYMDLPNMGSQPGRPSNGVPAAAGVTPADASVQITLEARGYGCVWETHAPPSVEALAFLAAMKARLVALPYEAAE